MFNSYVKFPEEIYVFPIQTSMTMWIYPLKMVIFQPAMLVYQRLNNLAIISQPRDARSWCERERTSEFCAIKTLQCGPPVMLVG